MHNMKGKILHTRLGRTDYTRNNWIALSSPLQGEMVSARLTHVLWKKRHIFQFTNTLHRGTVRFVNHRKRERERGREGAPE